MPKIALVTGGNRGLGFAVARQLADAGHAVVIGTREPRRGKEAASKLRADGLDADTVVLDVDDPASVERAARAVRDRYGRLDVLVNNAGVLPEATPDQDEVVSPTLFRRTFDTNLFGVRRGQRRRALPAAAARVGGGTRRQRLDHDGLACRPE